MSAKRPYGPGAPQHKHVLCTTRFRGSGKWAASPAFHALLLLSLMYLLPPFPLQKAAFQDANVCLFVFDCIYFNDISLMDR